jgi:hypothetical protein
MFGHKQVIGDGLVHPINNKIESYSTGAATAHICQIIILNSKIKYLKISTIPSKICAISVWQLLNKGNYVTNMPTHNFF